MQKIFLLFTLGFIVQMPASSQDAYLHISNKSIYTFLDEMANERIIELNSAVKPYTRMFIAKNWKRSLKILSN